MRISRVLIKNFRCFKKADINFEKCHALIGENATGKTTVLEAINLATSLGYSYVSEQDFNNTDEGDIEIEVFFDEPFLCKIPDGYTTQDILCQSVALNAHRRKQAASGKALSDQFVIDKYAVPLIYDSLDSISNLDSDKISGHIPDKIIKTDKGFESPRKSGSSFKFTLQRLSLHNEMVNYPNIFYFDRDREGEAKVGFNTLLSKINKDLNWRFRYKWNDQEVDKKWNEFYSEVIKTVIDPKNDRIMKPLNEKMKKIVGLDFNDLELSLLDIEQPFSKAFFSLRQKTNQIEQKNMGSGIAIMLAFFLLEIISNLAKGEIVFLIDEPELHLHPQLQTRLFEEFLKSSSQTIYTTQSDCMLSIAEWKSISRFYNDFSIYPHSDDIEQTLEGKKIREHLEEIKTFHQHKSIFFREDNQIFFSRKCLLVEGPAEKYGLPVLANKISKNLDGLTIISTNGKTKLPYYQMLCKAYNIPFFTLLDLDNQSETEGDNKRPCAWSGSNNRKTFSGSFEQELGISGDVHHKGSEVFIKIDNISTDEISKSIKENIKTISKWLKE